MGQPDLEALRQRERATWTAAAPGWKRHDEVVSRGAAPASERLLDLAHVKEGTRLLDLASGTGEPALAAARRVGESGAVLGTDLTEEMLAFAREKAAAAGYKNVEFRCVDAEALEVEPGSFDAVTSRWGVMFMPDPTAALRRAHAALRDGGRIAVATWAEPARVPFLSLPMSVVAQHLDVPAPPPDAPGIFSLADPKRLRSVLEDAGFSQVQVEELPLTMLEVESGAAYWAIMRELAGPIMALIRSLPEEKQVEVERQIAERAESLRVGDRVPFGGVAWLASGVK